MDKSNVFAIGAVILIAGFVVGRMDEKSRSAVIAAPAVAAPLPGAATPPPAAEPATEAPKPAGNAGNAAKAEPIGGAQAAAQAESPKPQAEAAKPSGGSALDSQSDEGAGKGVDVAKMGVSPKGMESPYIGVKDAVVVVNVFSDFQCPVCKRSADPIKQLAADFPGKVKVYFRNNALEMHGRSKPAALAAWAAKKQGKFWQYHDKLFSTGMLDDGSLEQAAKDLGLNMEQWKKDIADPANTERLAKESKWAESMGATGTPAFFVNGVRQVGWGSYMALKSMVGSEVEKGDALAKSGTAKSVVLSERITALAAKNTKNEGEKDIDAAAWAKNLTAD